MEPVAITFTLEELWLLHAFIRHEVQGMETWRMPPADEDLNDQIADAIVACVDGKLSEYTLMLTRQHLLAIDYWLRRDHAGPPMRSGQATGQEILLKTFRARSGWAQLPTHDVAYKEVRHADPGPDEDADGYTYTESF